MEHSAARVGGRRATADVLFQLGGRVLNLALGVLVTVLVVRTLGDEGFGQWVTVLTVVQLAEVFADFGLTGITVRMAAGDRSREADWIGAHVSLRVLTGIPVALACVPLVLVLSESDEMRAAGLIMSGMLIVGAPNALRSVFQVRVRNDVNMATLTLNSVLWAAVVITVASADGGMVPLAAGLLAVTATTASVQAFLALRALPLDLRRAPPLWRELATAAIPLGLVALLTLAYARIDQVLVFELAGDRDAGLYGAVYRILESSHFVPQAVMTTLLPIIAASWTTDRERVRRVMQRAGDYLAVASLPMLAVAIVAGEDIVRFLFGAEFAEAGPALAVLMGAFVLISFGFLAGNMVIVLGLQRRLLRYALMALVLNVALNLALVPEYGFIAAAWATLITEVFILTLSMRMVLSEAEMRPRFRRIGLTVVAAGLMGLSIWLLQEAGAPLAVVLAAAAVLYPPLLFAVRAITPAELAALLRRRPE